MRTSVKVFVSVLSAFAGACSPAILKAQPGNCSQLPDYGKLKSALTDIVKEGQKAHGGLGNQEWAALVDRDGIVCAVVFSGPSRASEWPGSRLIAATKANTANSFSLKDYALATGNLYAGSQPGGSLYGIASTPPNPAVAFLGPASAYGTNDDPMVGKPIGGVIVFGGGLALYTQQGEIVGGIGVSGDTSCADHVVAWKLRRKLSLDAVPMGPAPGQSDNLIFDIQNGMSESGFGQPLCKGGLPSKDIIENLVKSDPIGPRHMPR